MKRSYDEYEVNDFLRDDDFLLWRLCPTNESEAFWDQFMKEYPHQERNLARAIQILTSVKIEEPELSADEMKELDDIYLQTRHLALRHTRRRRHLYYTAAAACFAALCTLTFLYKDFRPASTGKEQVSTAYSNNLDSAANNIRLIMGKENKLLSSKNPEIVLNNRGSIQVTEEETNLISHSDLTEKEQVNSLIVPKGRRSSLKFADGTKIWVNSGSRIKFPSAFTEGIREIVLEEGEIYLEVAKDDAKPFRVRTSFGAVKVLGTRFNVMAYEADAVKSVVLAEGTVEVDFGLPGSLKLRPDEMLSITGETYRVDPVTAYHYTCWKDGIMQFTDEKLENVLLRLSRHYGVEFSCDEKLRAKACTGKMVLFDDIDHVLTTLSDIFPIRVQKNENQIQINVEPSKRQ